MDFKKATELFKDPDFDGEPVVIYEPGPHDDPVPPDPKGDDEEDEVGGEEGETIKKYHVSGVTVHIVSERVEVYGEDGKMVTESYRDYTRKSIRQEFGSLDNFLQKWNGSKKKAAIIDALAEYGIELSTLAKEVGNDYGDFDLICHIAFDQPPLTRAERANNVKKRNYFTQYGDKARAVLEALLDKYADEDIASIENNNVLKLDPFKQVGTPVEIINNVFGGKANYEAALQALETELFKQVS